MPCTTAGKQNPGDADAKGKRYATYQSRIWCTHACDNTQRYSIRCTYRRYLHAHIHGAQERPDTQYKHRTRWSRSTRTTTPVGDPQRRARQHQQQPKGGNKSTHQAHSPNAPPTRYAANTRSQRPKTTRTMTPALPPQPGPWGGEDRGGSDTTPTGTGTRPNPSTTYRLQRHKPNYKYRNTPAYPEPGPHGV